MEHKWKENLFDPHGQIGTMKTCVQHWICRDCGATVPLPLGCHPGDFEQCRCTGEKPRPKLKIKQKSAYEEKRDYPAKKKKRQ